MQSVHKGVGNCKLYKNKDTSLSAEACARLKVEKKLAVAGEFTFKPQSGKSTAQDAEITQSTTDHVEQNVKFADQIAPYEYDIHSAVDPTRRLQDTDDASLQDFFSRPIKLAQIEWGTSLQLNDEFDPWSLYFGNKRVVNRIANYKLLRANMHLKLLHMSMIFTVRLIPHVVFKILMMLHSKTFSLDPLNWHRLSGERASS